MSRIVTKVPKRLKMSQREWEKLTPRKRYELRYPARLRAQRNKYERGRIHSKYITQEDYFKVLERQGWVCAICRKPERQLRNNLPRRLSIDHDHKTETFRGLLCHGCNAALGLTGDNIEVLQNMIKYLRDNRWYL